MHASQVARLQQKGRKCVLKVARRLVASTKCWASMPVCMHASPCCCYSSCWCVHCAGAYDGATPPARAVCRYSHACCFWLHARLLVLVLVLLVPVLVLLVVLLTAGLPSADCRCCCFATTKQQLTADVPQMNALGADGARKHVQRLGSCLDAAVRCIRAMTEAVRPAAAVTFERQEVQLFAIWHCTVLAHA
eukprot:GHRQ01033686.1.p1 GENE.GHRQ01033686.1~~GHRQ01033686.1.p1  ORF type:complete len:191 (-),score=41.60 GHRQ01033686.1:104-676(-)